MMAEVYRCSSEVFLWLGEVEGSDQAQMDQREIQRLKPYPWYESGQSDVSSSPILSSVLSSLSAAAVAYPLLATDSAFAAFLIIYYFSLDLHYKEMPCFDESDAVADEFASGFKALVQLSQVAWWSRIWVVQEAIFPPKATVMYGCLVAPWDMFANAAHRHSRHSSSCCIHLSGAVGIRDHDADLDRLFLPILDVEYVRHSISRGEPVYLSTLLLQYRSRGATDPRDKVYGILGLVNDWFGEAAIMPDYSLDVSSVYAQATYGNILGRNNLFILMTSGKYRSDGLPSWLHDWGKPKSVWDWGIESKRTINYWLYNASSDLVPQASLHGGNVLSLKGICVDRITKVGEYYNYADWEVLIYAHESWQNLAGVSFRREEEYVAGGTRADAFWRTLIRDQIKISDLEFRKAAPRDKATYFEWFVHCVETDADVSNRSKDLEQFYVTIAESFPQQSFFLTEQGYMGLGTPAVGDEVWVLFGGNVPFVLRPCSPHYYLVSDCYVHGIMDGEALQIPGVTEATVTLV